MIEVIPAQEKHLEAIVEIWQEFMDYHKPLDVLFTRRNDGHKRFREFLTGLTTRDDALVLAALEDDKVVGYSLTLIDSYPPVFKIEKYGHIYDMAVKEGQRRKGAGEMMMREIERWCKEKGLSRMELQAVSKNLIGLNFWRKAGFKEYMKKMWKEIRN